MRVIAHSILIFTLWAVIVSPAFGQWPLGGQSLPAAQSCGTSPYVTGTGRFQVFVSPQTKDHTFMIDTDTGRVWILKQDHANGEFSLRRIPVEQVDSKKPGKSGAAEKKSDDKGVSKRK
jgi:hypothetical protein